MIVVSAEMGESSDVCVIRSAALSHDAFACLWSRALLRVWLLGRALQVTALSSCVWLR